MRNLIPPKLGGARLRLVSVAGGAVVLLLSGVAAASASASTSGPATDATTGLTCQRMVVVPDGANMWTEMQRFRPGDCVQTTSGHIPAAPPPPQRLVDHCSAVVNGTEPGRVQRGNDLGHLNGGDEVFEGDQTGSPARPAPGQADVIFGGPAYDTILDYSGENCLYGEEGADWIHAGAGDSLIDGGLGADTLYGGSGDDYIAGDALTAIPQPSSGNLPTSVDLLDGSLGDDVLIGGFGIDEMYGGPGNDLCVGSVGGDVADNDAAPSGSTIWVSTGVDPEGRPTGRWLNKYHDCETIWTKTRAPSGLEALLVVDGTQAPEAATGAAKSSDDPCAVPPWAQWQVASSGGCSTQWPQARNESSQDSQHYLWPLTWAPTPVPSAEQINQQDRAQSDSLRADLEHALATTADAHDRDLLEQALARYKTYHTADDPTCGQPTLSGTNDDNYLAGSNDADGSDRMYGGGGNNRLDGFGGDDCLSGGVGNDVLFGGKGSDVVYGGAGGDHLIGGKGNDVVYGGDGDDWLYGGTNDDVIDGGPGIDHCLGQSGHDVFINCEYIVGGLDQQDGNWGNIEQY